MSDHCVLVFDVGTQSSRAMIVDQKGTVRAIAKLHHEPAYRSPEPDWAEQDADYYYEMICRAAQQCRREHPDLFAAAEAVSITTIRDTVVCLDQHMKPLRPAILWLDQRTAAGKPNAPFLSEAAIRAAGMNPTFVMQYQKSHCNWIREEEPEIWDHTKYFVPLSTYLIYRMTGELKDASASMVGHIPFDHKHRRWMRERDLTYPVFPIGAEKYYPVQDSGTVLGAISASMAEDSGVKEGLPVYAAGSDKACELLGLGCSEESRAAIGLGTTATISYMSDTYQEPERFIPAYAAVIPEKWNPEIEIFRGYWLISWFKKEFASHEMEKAEELGISAEEILNRSLALIPAGCDGLIMQPYFTPNVTMPTARGAIIGFSDVHTRAHLYRAIVEGINFALIDGMRHIEKRRGSKFTSVAVGGGGSQSDEICQITADMFGLPILRTESYEATGIGCAMAAMVGMGIFDSYEAAVKSCVHYKDTFEPREKVTEIYNRLYDDVYQRTYGHLKPLYQKLHEIYHDSNLMDRNF
ncbi:MAG: FGGY-family carbohydrate kinase [Erysipelotrichaceae bacterium]|nr:FGGY-family carbohydrate kinase [Erysipelotrichaceae bacterium]